MEDSTKHMNLEDQRVGTPKDDGSIVGRTEKLIALRTGLGDPREWKSGKGPSGKAWSHWRGRRTVQKRIRELRDGGLLNKLKTKGRTERVGRARVGPSNRRHLVEKGPRAGTWRYYPAVRIVQLRLFERFRLDRTLQAEIEDLRQRRARGEVAPIVDTVRRRARDRQIKARQRDSEREQRILTYERDRLVAAKTSSRRRIE